MTGTEAARALTRLASPCDRRRAVGMKRLDRLEPPCLPLLSLLLGPYDRLPVGRQDEPGAGVGDFDPLIEVERDVN
jgi:hypothetical protein